MPLPVRRGLEQKDAPLKGSSRRSGAAGDAQDGGEALRDIGISGGPTGNRDAHGGMAVPGGGSAPAGAFGLDCADNYGADGLRRRQDCLRYMVDGLRRRQDCLRYWQMDYGADRIVCATGRWTTAQTGLSALHGRHVGGWWGSRRTPPASGHWIRGGTRSVGVWRTGEFPAGWRRAPARG